MPTSFAYPIRLAPGTGGLALSSGQQRVNEQIQEVLSTRFLERVLAPSFGSEDYLFSSLSSTSVISSRIGFVLRQGLSENIEVNVLVQGSDNGVLDINIKWLDTSENLQGNLISQIST